MNCSKRSIKTSQLTLDTFYRLPIVLDKFLRTHSAEINQACAITRLMAKQEDLSDRASELYVNETMPWRERDSLIDKIRNRQSEVQGEIEQALSLARSRPNSNVIDDCIHALEIELQSIARKYIEEQFGPIETMSIPNNDFEQLSKLNLYWLQHIIVQIDVHGTRNSKPAIGGGYFSKWPKKDNIRSKTASEINWHTDLAVHINIYSTEDAIWHMLTNRYRQLVTLDQWGEFEDDTDYARVFFKDVIRVFVHEMVHLEQSVRRGINIDALRKGVYKHTYTLLPVPGAKRPTVGSTKYLDTRGKPNQNTNFPRYKAGRRGGYVYGVEPDSKLELWSAYLGTVTEIDAHAADLAATAIEKELRDARWRRDNSFQTSQETINYLVDSLIQDLSHSNFNFGNYWRIEEEAIEALHKPNPTTRDKKFIAAWNRLRKKIVQHLLSYKKPVKDT